MAANRLKRLLAGVFIWLLATAVAHAQYAGTLHPGNVYGNPQAVEAPAIDSSVSAILDRAIGSASGTIAQRGPSTWGPAFLTGTENQLTKSAAYTVVPADCNTHFYLGGLAFYTFTIPAPSGFTSGCRIRVTNMDPMPNSGGRGKQLIVSGFTLPNVPLSNPMLYPGQTWEFVDISSTWVPTERPPLWYPEGSAGNGTIHFYVDCGAGSDTTNDGLAPGFGNAWLSMQNAWNNITSTTAIKGACCFIEIDSTGTCNGSANAVHIAGTVAGQLGRAGVKFNGQSSTTINPQGTAPCFAAFEHATIEITGFTCQNAGAGNTGYGVEALDGSLVILIGGNSWCTGNGSPGNGGVTFYATGAGSELDINTAQSVGCAGGLTYNVALFQASYNAVINAQNQSIQWAQQVSYTDAGLATVQTQAGGFVYLPLFNTAGFSIFGIRFNCSLAGMILGSGGSLTYIPGNSAGTTTGCTLYQ